MLCAVRRPLYSFLPIVRYATSASDMTSRIKDLRQKTSAGLADCKKALEASGGDMAEAIEWLRKKGVQSASKLSSRVSKEGLLVVSRREKEAVIVEVCYKR